MMTVTRFLQIFFVFLLPLIIASGCAKVRVTDPPRTATEQFLLSGAARKAIAQLSVEQLRGRDVFVETKYFNAPEEDFVIGELRATLLLAGVQLCPDRDAADIILEIRSGGVGIDREDFLLGLPSLVLAGDAAGGGPDIPFTTPEISILKNTDQVGMASVAFVAFWKETGEVVASSGPFIGVTYRDDWWFFGVGPRSVGDIPPVNVEPGE